VDPFVWLFECRLRLGAASSVPRAATGDQRLQCATLAVGSPMLIELSGVMGKWDFHPQETYKSLISIAIEALKALALVNGGAAVASLAYLGNVAAHVPAIRLPNMIGPLASFASGLFLTVLAFVGAYLTQLQLYQEDLAKDASPPSPITPPHRIFLWTTIATGVLFHPTRKSVGYL
jgi:hypothetical protein